MEQIQCSVKIGHIKKVLATLKKDKKITDDTELSFEFIIGSFFPASWKKIQDSLAREHTAGYLEGLAAGKENNEST